MIPLSDPLGLIDPLALALRGQEDQEDQEYQLKEKTAFP
jgi:hypothetical protein